MRALQLAAYGPHPALKRLNCGPWTPGCSPDAVARVSELPLPLLPAPILAVVMLPSLPPPNNRWGSVGGHPCDTA